MDTRKPTPPHIVIDGEHLELERLAANRGCVFTPWESFLIVGVTLAALGFAVWAANASAGMPV
jgi:hypothetical protein